MKITIEVWDTKETRRDDVEEVLLERFETENWESLEEQLGKMERRWREKDREENDNEASKEVEED